MRIVLFLGAGFSAPFGFPTMNHFFSAADESDVVSEEDRKFLDKLMLEARHANSFLQSSPTNLEDILSLAIMADRLRTSSSTQRSNRIKHILELVYTKVHDIPDYWEKTKVLKQFLGHGLSDTNHTLTVVTTNYDLTIESTLFTLGTMADPGFQYNNISSGKYFEAGQMYSMGGLPIYKLHGSVNWYKDVSPSRTFRVEGRIVSVMNNNILPLVCNHDYSRDKIPIIIPPTFLKRDLLEPLKKIWIGAAKALQNAEYVLFIGYSFPPSDIEMRYFLATSFVNNTRLRRIDIYDPEAEQIIDRLRKNESGYGSHFKALLKPHPASSWMKRRFSI